VPTPASQKAGLPRFGPVEALTRPPPGCQGRSWWWNAIEKEPPRVEMALQGVEIEPFLFERESLSFEEESLRLERESLRIEGEPLRFERECCRFEGESCGVEFDSARIEREPESVRRRFNALRVAGARVQV
jgi:hypothetical protein